MNAPRLDWFPPSAAFRADLKMLRDLRGQAAWAAAQAMARHDLDFVQTNALDQVQRGICEAASELRHLKLAILSSSTTVHLHAAIRVAALRRGLALSIYEVDYGQYRQELLDSGSALYDFRPDAVLFSFDARHISAGINAGSESPEVEARLNESIAAFAELWAIAKARLQAVVLQQTVLPVLPDLLGSNEHRLPGSAARFVDAFNERLRDAAENGGVDLISVHRFAQQDGIDAWHDVAMWHRAKQEVSVRAAPVYGDLVMRVLAAARGQSYKALVLDLDNTVWGGVVGDDGLDGILLGQGSAIGEAFVSFQHYAVDLARRGVLLAVCSKNDDAIARKAFADHPEMVIKPAHVASFVANWDDKAGNIRRIAAELNIGLDALVFADDSPFERALVRQELPMVAVPELPEDPALAVRCLSRAGYFESVALTDDDRARSQQYQNNRARRELAEATTDMDGYLAGLGMALQWSYVDPINSGRVLQLINKTNQFNLTTRRYSQASLDAVMDDPRAFGIALRLTDRFGDNGIISVIIGFQRQDKLVIDTWLMSCRVLGRGVERAALEIVFAEARRREAKAIVGEFIPSAKNAMVRDFYPDLGFSFLDRDGEDLFRFGIETAIEPPHRNHIISIERV